MESLLLKVLDFGLQVPTGRRQIEETGFVFIHVIVILYSAEIWHEVMLLFNLCLVPQLWNVPILKSHISKTFFMNYKKKQSKKVNFVFIQCFLYHQNAHFMLYTCTERYFKYVL